MSRKHNRYHLDAQDAEADCIPCQVEYPDVVTTP